MILTSFRYKSTFLIYKLKAKIMKHILSISLIFLVLVGFLSSCKESPNDGAPLESKVEFTFSSSQIKSASAQGLTNIVVSLEDLHGNVILNSEKIDIYHMNGRYISQAVEMPVGDYKLTRFLVLNGENDVVYTTPVEGSDKAHLVEKSLPIQFTADESSTSVVTPEVIAIGDSNPEEFGYVSFSFDIADSFKILMGAAVIDSSSYNYKLTNAHVEIFNEETLVYEGELNPYSSGADTTNYDSLNRVNEIVLPEKFDEFTVVVSKWGYKDYNKTFPKEELRLYYREVDKGPLITVLTAVDTVDCSTYAGIDRTLFAVDSIQLNAEELVGDAVGEWSIVAGSGTFEDATDPKTTVFDLAEGTNVFKWTMNAADTCIAYDEVEVNYVPFEAFAGEDQIISVDSTSLEANNPYPQFWYLVDNFR